MDYLHEYIRESREAKAPDSPFRPRHLAGQRQVGYGSRTLTVVPSPGAERMASCPL
jgi:hypothetical protein